MIYCKNMKIDSPKSKWDSNSWVARIHKNQLRDLLFFSLVLLLTEIDSVAWCVCVRNRILNVSSVDWNTKNILFSFECRVRSLLHCSVECVYVHRVCAENKIRSRLLVDARVTFVETNPFTGATASKQKPNGMKMELQSVSRMRQRETEELPKHDKSKSNTHLKRT